MQALSTAELFCRGLDEPPVLFEESLGARKVVLNRPSRLNSITFEMASQMIRKLRIYEDDHTANLVILKGNGQAFCSGGDLISNMCFMLTGHWSFGAIAYKKLLTLTYLIASYKKPLVCLIDGIVMGSGAGISMYGSFRVVTDNTVFAMPEASIGLFPDVGASHFLSKLPGYFGEYVGLTGARLNGATMLACGLATHFVFSKDLPSLEHALSSVDSSNASEILSVIDKFAQKTNTKEEDFHKRLKSINKCFSRQTVEGILHSLEKELEDNLTEKWIADAVNNMKSASPTSLKIFLRSIREGRGQTIEQCLAREYTIHSNIIRRKITNDFYEGSRAMLFDKDKKPKKSSSPSDKGKRSESPPREWTVLVSDSTVLKLELSPDAKPTLEVYLLCLRIQVFRTIRIVEVPVASSIAVAQSSRAVVAITFARRVPTYVIENRN